MATITPHAHKDLASFLNQIVTLASAGDYIDGAKLARSHYGNRPFSTFPNVPLTTTKTKPTLISGAVKGTDRLYSHVFPQRFGIFLNDLQNAVATGGDFAGQTIDTLETSDARLKPYFRCNILFKASTPTPTVTAKTGVTAKA